MKIAFFEEKASIRGTTVALYDYANFNELLLNNKSIIVMSRDGFLKSDPKGIVRLISRFRIFTFCDQEELDRILVNENCDILYCIKYGTNDKFISKRIKTVIHCVFDMSQPHGDIYAGVSENLAKKYNKKEFVPHMISLTPSKTENMRKELNISESAIVFGRYGGLDTFNIDFCWKVIDKIVKERSDIYFIFINTPQIVKHKNIMYLPTVTSENEKNKFISTCDAYLECGTLGHSFGLAIGEFSVNNKPIIAFNSPLLWNTSHIDILGNKGLYFKNEIEFYTILNSFNKNDYVNRDLNCYKNFSPERVMEKFKNVFIDSKS